MNSANLKFGKHNNDNQILNKKYFCKQKCISVNLKYKTEGVNMKRNS